MNQQVLSVSKALLQSYRISVSKALLQSYRNICWRIPCVCVLGSCASPHLLALYPEIVDLGGV
ncbi:hypothetical protein HMPREF1584_01272 [Gardnerella vaginalis JCP8481A]|nr:hypothetical protein HMPREF1584_01272 [Gardnerella vaginalis JCP8481A]